MRPKSTRHALIVFARNPVAGAVKTRLARIIGDEEASNLYRAFLLDSVRAFSRVEADLRLYLTPSLDEIDRSVLGVCPETFAQKGRGLGQRMANAIGETFRAGYGGVGIVGSDIPTLSPEILSKGYALLTGENIVIGPSVDGGYYCLILSHNVPQLFEDVAFGRGDVFRKTIERAESLGLSVSILESQYDVDTISDLERLVNDLRDDPSKCPETHRTLKHLGILQAS